MERKLLIANFITQNFYTLTQNNAFYQKSKYYANFIDFIKFYQKQDILTLRYLL